MQVQAREPQDTSRAAWETPKNGAKHWHLISEDSAKAPLAPRAKADPDRANVEKNECEKK